MLYVVLVVSEFEVVERRIEWLSKDSQHLLHKPETDPLHYHINSPILL